MSLPERFLEKRIIDLEKGCWLWTGQKLPKGYGRVWYKGKKRLVHRVVAHLEHGMDLNAPREVQALHTCDVKPCFNPAHIYVSDHAQNFRDAVERDRVCFGERQWKAKLTPDQVREVAAYAREHTGKAAAEKFGLSRSHVSNIVNGKAWRRLWA